MRDAFVNVQHSGYALRVIRDPRYLELRNLERRVTAKLAFIIIDLVGLVGDIDAGHMCCYNHFCLLSAMPSPSLGILIES